MKKTYLILLCIIVNAGLVFSQNLQIYNSSHLVNNSVVNISGVPSEQLKCPLQVKNLSNVTLDVKVKKIYGNQVQGTDNTFCFAIQCYGPSTLVSFTSAAIAPSAIDSSFEADYNANGNSGTTTVTYVFFNTDNSSDSASVTVNYNSALGINDIVKSDIYLSDAYPNPAANNVSFSYSLPGQTKSAKIAIRNILGATVTYVELNDANGKKTINTGELKEGIYFYSLIVNDKTFYTKKLIVKH